MNDGTRKLLAGGAALYLAGSIMVAIAFMLLVGLLIWAFLL